MAEPTPAQADTRPDGRSGNPIFPGWYADPEAAVFDGQYWVYPTCSDVYERQTFFDAFSSPDLVHWTKHPHIFGVEQIRWAHRALWAPAVAERGGRFFHVFAANDIQASGEAGGLGVAVADQPGGPFVDHLGTPLLNAFHNGAQPIDPFLFRDRDGTDYLVYGGWRHCNIARLKPDFTGFLPLPDGSTFREITPLGYVEGPLMLERQGRYYFMWSEGEWTGPDYSVAYAMADSPMGPFRRIATILEQDPQVARGAGHHGVIRVPGRDEYYIVYHRRPLAETDGNHRQTCIDKLEFDADGRILPVRITFEGVAAVPMPG